MNLSEVVQYEIVTKAKEFLEEKAKTATRNRGRKKKIFYFTQETENAIVLYNKMSWKSDVCVETLAKLYDELHRVTNITMELEDKELKLSDLNHKIKRLTAQLEYTTLLYTDHRSTEIEYWKNKIFSDHIIYPLEKIVENMYNKYKLSYFDAPPDHIKTEALHNLLLNLHKYDESKGTRAFSYFTVVAKHYLMQLNNSNHRRYKRSTLMSTMPENWEIEDNFFEREDVSEWVEFKGIMLDFWDKNLTTVFRKKRDIQIADAILELFRRSDSIENFNKKHLYLLIREMADCKTQYITRVVNIMKKTQFDMLTEFRNTGDIVEVGREFNMSSSFKW